MRLFSIKNISTTLLVLAAAVSVSNAQQYSGRSVAAEVTVAVVGQPVVKAGLSDTGDLSHVGGNVGLVGLGTNLAGIANIGAANVNAAGVGNLSSSTSSVASTSLNVLGNTISTGIIQAATQASCPGSVFSGTSSVAGLQINGLNVTVLGTPNQSVTIFANGPGGPVAVGQLILNEEISDIRGVTRNGIHLIATALDGLTRIEIIVSSSRSRIDCGQASTANIFGGRGKTVQLNQRTLGPIHLSNYVADTGKLSGYGGDTAVSTAGANVAGLVSTGTVTSTTEGGIPAGTPNRTASSSDVENLGVNVLGPLLGIALNATAVESDTVCTCGSTLPTCSGSSSTANLSATALGLPVTIPVNPPTNTVINILGVGILHLNEEVASASGNFAEITRNALRLELNALVAGTDLTVASSKSSIVCGLAPTAAEVDLSGRVNDPYGRGLSRTAVSVIDGSGFTKTVVTNSFGNYILRGLPAGRTYIVSVASKQHTYEPRVISLEDNLSGFDFMPTTPPAVKKF